jgi:hypothetical protein
LKDRKIVHVFLLLNNPSCSMLKYIISR